MLHDARLTPSRSPYARTPNSWARLCPAPTHPTTPPGTLSQHPSTRAWARGWQTWQTPRWGRWACRRGSPTTPRSTLCRCRCGGQPRGGGLWAYQFLVLQRSAAPLRAHSVAGTGPRLREGGVRGPPCPPPRLLSRPAAGRQRRGNDGDGAGHLPGGPRHPADAGPGGAGSSGRPERGVCRRKGQPAGGPLPGGRGAADPDGSDAGWRRGRCMRMSRALLLFSQRPGLCRPPQPMCGPRLQPKGLASAVRWRACRPTVPYTALSAPPPRAPACAQVRYQDGISGDLTTAHPQPMPNGDLINILSAVRAGRWVGGGWAVGGGCVGVCGGRAWASSPPALAQPSACL